MKGSTAIELGVASPSRPFHKQLCNLLRHCAALCRKFCLFEVLDLTVMVIAADRSARAVWQKVLGTTIFCRARGNPAVHSGSSHVSRKTNTARRRRLHQCLRFCRIFLACEGTRPSFTAVKADRQFAILITGQQLVVLRLIVALRT